MILGVAVLIALRAQAAQPVQARTAPSKQPATPPSGAGSDELVFVKSVFDDSLKTGKDPFFPKSERVIGRRPVSPTTSDLPDLVLKGISVQRDKRLAMINNCTLELGEEGEIKAGGRTYRIRCVEINDNSVVVNYKGLKKELVLRKGY